MPHHAIAARVSIDSESATQVRPSVALESVPWRVRALKSSTVELLGGLYLPRQCAVRVSFSDATHEPCADLDSQALAGEVRKVQMLDGTPEYVLSVHLSDASPQALQGLRTRLEG